MGKSEEQFPKDIVGQLLYTDVSQAGNSWAKLLPIFYKQCFDAWSELNAKTPSLLHEIANEVIWNNKFFCINKKSVYRRDIADLGF